MKKKMVIRMLMSCEKCRCKAMKIAVCVPGVESAALTGQEKDQMEVVGDEVDSVALTRKLRKKVGHAVLVSLSEVKKEEKKPDEVKVALVPSYGIPHCYCCEVREEQTCTIL